MTNELDTSRCVRVGDDGPDGPSKPWCEVAREVALARKAALDAVLGEATAVSHELDEEKPNLALIGARIRSIIDVSQGDPTAELVTDDDLLLAIVGALESIVSAEPSALLQQALEVRRAVVGDGWILVRPMGWTS